MLIFTSGVVTVKNVETPEFSNYRLYQGYSIFCSIQMFINEKTVFFHNNSF